MDALKQEQLQVQVQVARASPTGLTNRADQQLSGNQGHPSVDEP
jgi:hypothetical protein